MTTKLPTITVVRNVRYGGFGISAEAIRWMRERGHDGAKAEVLYGEHYPTGELNDIRFDAYGREFLRTDPLLAECVRTLGDKANGESAELVVDTLELSISFDEHDGKETYTRVYGDRVS